MNTQAQTASNTLNGAAEKMKSDAASAASTAREAAAKLAESAKTSVGEYAASGAQAFKDAVEDQKKVGAGAIGDVARSAKEAAEGFEETSPQLAGAVRSVADRVENLSNDIRDRSVNELMASVTDFASKKPIAFFGCGILAGVVLARLLEQFGTLMPGVLGPFAAELGAFFDKVGKLAQLDALLLKAELRDSGMRLVSAVVALAIALAVVLFSLLFLGAAAVLFLIELGLRPSLAALLLGAFFILFAGGLALWAFSHLRNWSLKPRRTIAQVTRNLEALKASIRDQARTHP